jgi:dihydroneopterin aldolase
MSDAPQPAAGLPIRRVFVRNLVLDAAIGIYPSEMGRHQRVRINIDLAVEDVPPRADSITEVVSYEGLVSSARAVVSEGGHVQLVETLAERLAACCFGDPRILSARIRVEKLDIFEEAEAVGVEIERFARK